MSLPKDPFMLVSVLNTYLRDFYSNLDEMCEDREIDKEEMLEKVNNAGFKYDAEQNQFRR